MMKSDQYQNMTKNLTKTRGVQLDCGGRHSGGEARVGRQVKDEYYYKMFMFHPLASVHNME